MHRNRLLLLALLAVSTCRIGWAEGDGSTPAPGWREAYVIRPVCVSVTRTWPTMRKDATVQGLHLSLAGAETRRVVGLDLGLIGPVRVRKAVKGVQAGLATCKAESLIGIGFAGGMVSSVNVRGMQAAMACSETKTELKGLQISGGLSRCAATTGLQLAGFGCDSVRGRVTGIQAAGVICAADGGVTRGLQLTGGVGMAGSVTGLQLSGVMSRAGGVRWVQAACGGSLADSVVGIQLGGLTSIAGHVKGVQIGLVNVCRELRGVQIGLVNISRDHKIPALPLLNVRF